MAMKRLSLALVLVALSCAVPPGDAAACGDKFLVIGRGARRVQKARHPASILLALRADARLASAVRAMKLEATLKLAGHTVETMPEPASLAEWLATRRYDFIVTGLDGAAATVRDSASAASRPAVIPVTLDANGAARAAAEKQYGLVIPAPSKSLAYLGALDAAMGGRPSIASR
jgi:hypothetical protein